MSRTSAAVICGGVVVLACAVAVWRGLDRAIEAGQAADARQTLRDIRSAEAAFKSRRARFGTLTELIDAGLLVTTRKGGVKSSYRFVVSPNIDTYEAVALPDQRDEFHEYQGSSYFLDESQTIRWAPFGKMNGYRVAAKTDPPIPQE